MIMLCTAVQEIVTPVTLHSLRTPATLDRVRVWGAEVVATAQTVPKATRPDVWLGETGSAQAGGQSGVSGRWVATLWWLDQLGSLAVLHHKVQCRQTLSGSDYGLIDDQTMRPTPEFWASVLWRRLMGRKVYAARAEGAADTMRVYCHENAAKPGGGKKGRSCLFLNLADAPVAVELGGGRGARQPELWLLESTALDSGSLTINKASPETAADGTVPALPGSQLVDCGPEQCVVALPPRSAAFVRI